MLSLPTVSSSSSSSSSFAASLKLLRRNPRIPFRVLSSSSSASLDSAPPPPPSSPSSQRREGGGCDAGLRLEERVEAGTARSRIDSWVSSRIQGVSRARIQSSIRAGLVAVNGRIIDKVSHMIKGGDLVRCTVAELRPLRAEPEDIPLNIVYEDEHVLVVNKPAHMVVHPAPGNANGTLVNAILHHCRLPTASLLDNNRTSVDEECSELSDDEIVDPHINQFSFEDASIQNHEALVRPGIVHRLDKGTSGLLVVAKDAHSHAHLAEQFKQHTIHRVYLSLTSGVPNPTSGRVEIPITRDPNNRIRMIAMSGFNSRYGRYAASRYKVIKEFMDGGAALVQWRLETGRTHQIRAHAKYLGVPLLGDEVYGGTKSMALSLLRPRIPSTHHGSLASMISKLERPCLHALSLGFEHPCTGEFLRFKCPPPDDFSEPLGLLQFLSNPLLDKGL